MKIIDLLEQDDNVIKGKFRKPNQAAIDALERHITQSMEWPEHLYPLKMPERKSGFWLSVFTISDQKKHGTIGPFKTNEAAKANAEQFIAKINGVSKSQDPDEYDDVMGHIDFDEWYDGYAIRVPSQFGSAPVASVLSEDEVFAVVTEGLIPVIQNVFLHDNSRAAPVKAPIIAIQEEIAQTRYDLEVASLAGLDTRLLQQRLAAQIDRLHNWSEANG